MVAWYCFKCEKQMEDADIAAVYLELEGTVKGIKCPSCGITYLTEQEVMNVISKGEEELEAKAG